MGATRFDLANTGASPHAGLDSLERELARDSNLLAYPSTPWTRAAVVGVTELTHDTGLPSVHEARARDDASFRATDDVDVAIIGAGQAGTAVAAKLRREGVERVLVIDRAPEGLEGPWLKWARMHTLRSAKELHGPDAGYAAASFRRWYTAQHGEAGWNDLDLIPRVVWSEYLQWIRRVFALTVRNGTEVVDVVPDGTRLVLQLREGEVRSSVTARRLIVCTGTDGIGGAELPEFAAQLNPTLWRHSSDQLPLDSLAGARVGVLGVGASAFDNAATALEAGAEVVLFSRRDRLPTVNSVRSLETRGFFRHFDALPDAARIELGRRALSLTVPPPQHSVERCTVHEGFELRLGAAWVAVGERDGRAIVTLADGTEEEFDLLIFGTGFRVDLERVPWLGTLRAGLATWADRAELGSHPADERLGRFPYLGRGMAGTALTPEAEPWAQHVHFLNHAATMSAGPAALGINGLPAASDHLVDEVCRSLLMEESERLAQAFLDHAVEPEFEGAGVAGSGAR